MTTAPPDPAFEALLEYLRRSRGFDFSAYKRTSLMRRVSKRMQMVGVDGYESYLDYLEVHPEEFTHLFNTLLINVTSFFRDPEAWEYLRAEVLPRLVAAKKATDPVRVWCAGASSGEEAYTLAICLAEHLGEEQFRERVKIYATDVDEEALNHARLATYGPKELLGVPEELAARYFEPSSNQRYTFRKDLRRTVIFGRHDLIQDAPISRIDLLVCRNTLMYFNAEAQARILARFHFALNEAGYLFLGKAEMLFTQSHLFTSVDLKRRVLAKVPRVNLRDQLFVMAQTGSEEAVSHLSKHVRFREAVFDSSPTAHIAVDLNGFLALANERARALFGLTVRDQGRPLPELELFYRVVGLRPALEKAQADRRPVQLTEVEWPTASGDVRYLDIQVLPLLDNGSNVLGASVTFTDVTAHKRLQAELEHANQELETAYEELQSTNEELETTNEELQSTIEELETTNEELQSTNEELETMNEELQSTNEELQTINDELRRRTNELNQVNAFFRSVLASLRDAVVVLDQELNVQAWNARAEDLWGLRADEVEGKNFLNLDLSLPVDQLRTTLRSCVAGQIEQEEQVLTATNRRGRPIRCRVTCSALIGPGRETRGAILVMEAEAVEAEAREG